VPTTAVSRPDHGEYVDSYASERALGSCSNMSPSEKRAVWAPFERLQDAHGPIKRRHQGNLAGLVPPSKFQDVLPSGDSQGSMYASSRLA